MACSVYAFSACVDENEEQGRQAEGEGREEEEEGKRRAEGKINQVSLQRVATKR